MQDHDGSWRSSSHMYLILFFQQAITPGATKTVSFCMHGLCLLLISLLRASLYSARDVGEQEPVLGTHPHDIMGW